MSGQCLAFHGVLGILPVALRGTAVALVDISVNLVASPSPGHLSSWVPQLRVDKDQTTSDFHDITQPVSTPACLAGLQMSSVH